MKTNTFPQYKRRLKRCSKCRKWLNSNRQYTNKNTCCFTSFIKTFGVGVPSFYHYFRGYVTFSNTSGSFTVASPFREKTWDTKSMRFYK